MCGIAGIWNLNGESIPKGKLEQFTDAMMERGPDGSGYDYFVNNTMGLAHRRLSILDLSEAGHQPMYYADNRYAITYNGEVFNFMDIRAELETLGCIFRTETDTEVVLAAFAKWGPLCLNKFNGMWAFAIWDSHVQELFMARDRFGIKPYYYYHKPGELLAFASETRCFQSLQNFNRELDVELVELQAGGARIHGSGHSIFKDIKSILPGHAVTYKLGGPFVQKRWWNIQDHLRKDIPNSIEDQAKEFYEIFKDACRIRLISDVSVGTALSGGLDSSSVYSVVFDLLKNESLSRVHTDSQKAVVATFPGLVSDERHYAEKALEFTHGPAIFLTQEYGNLPERIVSDTLKFDGLNNSPITSVSGIYKGMKEAGITVSMDGHGVDEMMYGYRDMIYNLIYYYHNKGDRKALESMKAVLLPTYLDNDRAQAIKNIENISGGSNSPIQMAKRIVKKILNKKYNPDANRQLPAHLKTLGNPYNFEGMSYADRIVFTETFTETLPDIFRNFDLAGMMNSVEIRMPFMDWRLVTYVFSLPLESKIGNGFTKLVLREAMKGKMAEEIRVRTHKVGISSPVEHWFKGELKTWVQDAFHSHKVVDSLMLTDKEFINKLDINFQKNSLNFNQIQKAWMELNLQIIKGNLK